MNWTGTHRFHRENNNLPRDESPRGIIFTFITERQRVKVCTDYYKRACKKVMPHNSIFHNEKTNINQTKPGIFLELYAVILNTYILLNIITSAVHTLVSRFN
jgi:hypothetical protein